MASQGLEWRFETLSRRHNRTSFSSGVDVLDAFVQLSARQNAEAGISVTIVAVRPGTTTIGGFFTMRMGAVSFDLLPEKERRSLPRYPVPVVHLARLAVDVRERGQRLGEQLLMECLSRALRANEDVPAFAIEVAAKDADAVAFYSKYGFRSLLDDERHMYLSIKAIKKAFGR